MTRHKMTRLIALAGLALALAGCYKTVIYDGNPPGHSPVAYRARWHHGFVLGIVEIPSDGHMLDDICPGGWSEIHTRTSFLNGFVQGVLWGAYNPQTISVYCDAKQAEYELELDEDGQVAAVRPLD